MLIAYFSWSSLNELMFLSIYARKRNDKWFSCGLCRNWRNYYRVCTAFSKHNFQRELHCFALTQQGIKFTKAFIIIPVTKTIIKAERSTHLFIFGVSMQSDFVYRIVCISNAFFVLYYLIFPWKLIATLIYQTDKIYHIAKTICWMNSTHSDCPIVFVELHISK